MRLAAYYQGDSIGRQLRHEDMMLAARGILFSLMFISQLLTRGQSAGACY